MSSQLAATTDLTFVARPRRPVPVAGPALPAGGRSRLAEQPAGVLVELGARWRPGDATLLLAGIRRAIRQDAPITLCHRGAGGMSLLRAAAAEQPGLRVRERIRGQDGLLYKQPSPHWQRRPLPTGSGQRRAAVAITGGLGGIGLRLAAHLGELGHPIWLIDRRPVSGLPSTAQHALSRLATRTRLVVSQADVRTGCGQPPFPIRHLVYAAGELELVPVAELDADELERRAGAKAGGLRRCTEQLLAGGLRSVLAFGSVESRHPHRTFGGYALANELLRLEADRLRERHRRLRLVTAEWTLWDEVGMAADAARFAGRAGFAVVPADWGAQASASLLTQPGELPDGLALGGPQSDADQPVRAIAGIGGSSHCLRQPSVDRLVALCRHGQARGRRRDLATARGLAAGHRLAPVAADRGAGPVLRAVVRGGRLGAWASSPGSWEPSPGGSEPGSDGREPGSGGRR
jgi:hypothetical protein